ncbi:cytochrome c-type biogenesis protein CcmE [Striga asiatica]|uniref:Cytochrome c-type biogenesis protein CcmE n=1 Tax=Striga asiatica TaxID=4170 RepID=A0A5A7PHP6_STRAF|nr:cytochrome c-type biogenesis protein CcmE [Striga asiatica]
MANRTKNLNLGLKFFLEQIILFHAAPIPVDSNALVFKAHFDFCKLRPSDHCRSNYFRRLSLQYLTKKRVMQMANKQKRLPKVESQQEFVVKAPSVERDFHDNISEGNPPESEFPSTNKVERSRSPVNPFGIGPDNRLLLALNTTKLSHGKTSPGISPENSLLLISKRDKQGATVLLGSSPDKLDIGIVPFKLFRSALTQTWKDSSLERLPISGGKIPLKSFMKTLNGSRLGNSPRLWGISPDKLFMHRPKNSNFSNFPKSSGILPVNLFSDKSRLTKSSDSID